MGLRTEFQMRTCGCGRIEYRKTRSVTLPELFVSSFSVRRRQMASAIVKSAFLGSIRTTADSPSFGGQLFDNGRVWAEIDLVYVLFAKGPLGNVPAMQRRDFLQYKRYVDGMELGSTKDGVTYLCSCRLIRERLAAWNHRQCVWFEKQRQGARTRGQAAHRA